ncbi:proteasome assembly chaperone family protein [Candidatus Bathyarchaeota archaeon]|nr:proteasome assembly chaperone family protein [Candidatus Bathyarchaeota archaeon]
MVCVTRIYEKPVLNSPILIEGLPGIGFVANIAALHLIQGLKAKMFSEIRSSSFQDFAISTENGKARFPISEIYYHKGRGEERDLLILYGNTQALTTLGQYELCGRVLDIAEELGCRQIITLGGLKHQKRVEIPGLYCAASDPESLREALSLGAKVLHGHIFGVAGLLLGLGKLRGMKGFCLLAQTPGLYPDATAAQEVLRVVCKMLRLRVDLSRLDVAAEATRNILESFGFGTPSTEEKAREKPRSRWLI